MVRPHKAGLYLKLLPSTLLLFSGAAHAADNWDFQPFITESGTWASNPLLVSGGQKDLYGSITEPGFSLATHTPTTDLTARATLDENIFNQSVFNSTDGHGDIKLQETLQQWGAGIGLHSDYDTTRTSELTTLNNSAALGAVRHYGNQVAPNLSFSPSGNDKIVLDGSYVTSHYDSNVFSDYHILTVDPSYQYSYNKLNTLVASLPTSRYETDSGINTKTDSIAPTVGWFGDISPQLSAKVNIGYAHYTQPYISGENKDWKWTAVYDAELNYKTDIDLLNGTFKRELQPYNDGLETFLNTLSIKDTHRINELFSTDLGASYQFSNDHKLPDSLKSLIGADAGLTYHATQTIDITGSYQYREQELADVSGTQTDNEFLLSLTYHPSLSLFDEKK